MPDPLLTRERRAELLDRFERATELPLVVLALLMLPLLLVPLAVDLPDGADAVILALDWLIWVVFAVELSIRLALTDRRLAFLRREWADVVIVVLPFLRPLRIARSARALRLLRLARLGAVIGVVEKDGRRLLHRSKVHYAVAAALVLLVVAALVVHSVEAGEGGSIRTIGDAFWWAIATMTTVGYGDEVPVTPAGRAVAAFLMLTGIALFGVVTASLAAFMVERDEVDESADLGRQIDVLTSEVRRLSEKVEHLSAVAPAPQPD